MSPSHVEVRVLLFGNAKMVRYPYLLLTFLAFFSIPAGGTHYFPEILRAQRGVSVFFCWRSPELDAWNVSASPYRNKGARSDDAWQKYVTASDKTGGRPSEKRRPGERARAPAKVKPLGHNSAEIRAICLKFMAAPQPPSLAHVSV